MESLENSGKEVNVMFETLSTKLFMDSNRVSTNINILTLQPQRFHIGKE